jgi:hypothetical protein
VPTPEIFLLAAVVLAAFVLLAVAFISALGLDPDQKQLKRSLLLVGGILCVRGVFGSWYQLVLGLVLLMLSHPKINLPRFSRRLDKSLDHTDHPARYVP